MTNSASSKPQNYTSLAAIRSQSAPNQLVDILMTNAWPSSIAQLSTVPLPSPDLPANGAPPLDEVIRNIKPRYHFAAKGGQPSVFWEREPYTWDRDGGRVSRFVSLGAFGGEVTTGKKPRVCLIHHNFSQGLIILLVVLRVLNIARFRCCRQRCETSKLHKKSLHRVHLSAKR